MLSENERMEVGSEDGKRRRREEEEVEGILRQHKVQPRHQLPRACAFFSGAILGWKVAAFHILQAVPACDASTSLARFTSNCSFRRPGTKNVLNDVDAAGGPAALFKLVLRSSGLIPRATPPCLSFWSSGQPANRNGRWPAPVTTSWQQSCPGFSGEAPVNDIVTSDSTGNAAECHRCTK